ncbi:hypothetical protein CCACVL1_01953 [Corchorus capsularis]|uniref:J domain-containing protein n=1 Tax=Corchorus capsularis TaxID=210143 RepID=A0A1R3KE20_COCAP|nr:hypothetical protein CCACVL1_01953 [Corchorus capsularis]
MAEFRVQAAEKAKIAAEEYFKLGNLDMAIEQASAARDLNPNLPLIDSYIIAYMIHKLASMESIYRKKRKTHTLVFTYRVLDIEDCSSGVDEATIRKHYRETALLVHPDKNDSVAAEGAFKIVQQALNSLLSDHNRKRKFRGRS